MVKVRSFTPLLMTFLGLSLLLVSTAEAQGPEFTFDANGGIAIPIDEVRSLYDDGSPTFGGDFTWWATSQFGIRASTQIDLLSGKDASEVTGPVDVPDMDLFRGGGGFAFRPLAETGTSFLLEFDVGVGMTIVTTDDFPAGIDGPDPDNPGDRDFSESYVTLNGGTKVGYNFTDRLGAFVGWSFYRVDTDFEDFRQFGQFDPQSGDTGPRFGEIWTFPITGGVRIHF